MPEKLRMLDVFCGMGALSIGFEKEGCVSVLGVESERPAAGTFAMNRPDAAVLLGDCRKFSIPEIGKAIGRVDIVVGGVPCEPFSAINRFSPKENDSRRGLINYAINLVVALGARGFVFENVPGAVKSERWKRARARAERLGYKTAVWVLRASEHGAATIRQRAFFVGVKGGQLPEQDGVPRSRPRSVRDVLSGLGPPGGEGLHSAPPPLSDRLKLFVQILREGKSPEAELRAGRLSSIHQGDVLIRSPDKPAPTLIAQGAFIHWGGKRWLTLRETARIQGIPDSYKFAVSTWTGVRGLLGDCVPVPLASAVAKAFLSSLRSVKKSVALVSRDPTGKFLVQAERAEKNDKLTLGEFFYQPKPTRPAFPEELQTIERFLSLYRERADEWLPTHVQKKFDGARHQVHKDGDTVKIFSEDGEDNTARLPQTVEEIRKLKVDKLVFDCEIELWKGRQHLPREAIAGYLHAKDEPDDSNVVTNVFDVLYHGEDGDVHKWPVFRRLELLGKLGVEQSTMGAPDLKHRLNAVPGTKAHDLEELERAVRKIRELPGSEGVVAKQADSPYPLKVVTLDLWTKFHNSSIVRGIVLGREKTKGGVWVYQYGVLPGKAKPIKTVQVKGKTVTPVGDTFATKLDFAEGDPILIEGETINIERKPEGERMSVWVPRVIGPWTDKTDTVDSAAARAKRNLVLQVKEIDEEGNIEYLPTRAVEKQADPYMEIPDEDKAPYAYSVQHHFRGKSMHSDLRIVLRPKRLLIGWTLLTGIKGEIKEPVTKLSQARALSRTRMDEISKINWNTGEWAKRRKRGVKEPVRTSINSVRKAAEPYDWLNVEGATKMPEEGKPPPVGGTREFPGVFQIVDQGEAEYLAQKVWLHEYAMVGKALNYRIFFRQLRLKKDGTPDDEDLPENLKGEVLSKAVLPPSEESELPGPVWLCIRPDDQTPYVLDRDAVKKGWMPPVGISALPKAIRKQVPVEYRYWKSKTAAKAKQTRDALQLAIKAKDVEIDYTAPYKRRTTKASMLDARFVLQEQTWRGPIQIRVGPSRTLWHLRLDVGRPELIVVEMYLNPLDNKRLAADVKDDPHKESMKFEGEIKPSHYLNPTKATPSNIEILDSGKASVLSYSDKFLKVQIKGELLKGLYEAKRSDGDWLWQPSVPGPEVKKEAGEMAEVFKAAFVNETVIAKVDKEKRIVTGIVLEPDEVDAQGDTIDAEAIERAAHKFLASYNRETQLGVLHTMFGEIGVELVESWIAKTSFKLGDQKVTKGTWLMSNKINDDTLWKKVKKGEITGFSIQGVATVI